MGERANVCVRSLFGCDFLDSLHSRVRVFVSVSVLRGVSEYGS